MFLENCFISSKKIASRLTIRWRLTCTSPVYNFIYAGPTTVTLIATKTRDERLLTQSASPSEEDGPRGFSYQLRSRSTRGAANIHYAAERSFATRVSLDLWTWSPLEASSPSAGRDYRDGASPWSCPRESRGL